MADWGPYHKDTTLEFIKYRGAETNIFLVPPLLNKD